MKLEQIQAFFLKAMVEGYVAGGQKIKIPDMPGYKAIPFRDGDFYLLDRWCVTPHSNYSAGTTTIWYQEIPVWVMNYGGFYYEEVIEFLRHALHHAYKGHEFFGGRGPRAYVEDGVPLIYVNNPIRYNFDEFSGRETILDSRSGGSLGFHDYRGMSLLNRI